jgi:hypothetical protein
LRSEERNTPAVEIEAAPQHIKGKGELVGFLELGLEKFESRHTDGGIAACRTIHGPSSRLLGF